MARGHLVRTPMQRLSPWMTMGRPLFDRQAQFVSTGASYRDRPDE
jgi:hypothetical protein